MLDDPFHVSGTLKPQYVEERNRPACAVDSFQG